MFLEWISQDLPYDLPRDVQELVTLVVGQRWQASYEFWAHAEIAAEAGLPAPVIEALRLGERPALERPDLQAAYDVVTEFFATNRVSDATYARAVASFGEKGLVDLVGLAGAYMIVCMTLAVFDLGVPPGEPDPFG